MKKTSTQSPHLKVIQSKGMSCTKIENVARKENHLAASKLPSDSRSSSKMSSADSTIYDKHKSYTAKYTAKRRQKDVSAEKGGSPRRTVGRPPPLRPLIRKPTTQHNTQKSCAEEHFDVRMLTRNRFSIKYLSEASTNPSGTVSVVTVRPINQSAYKILLSEQHPC